MAYRSSDTHFFNSSFDCSNDSENLRKMKASNRQAFQNIPIPDYLIENRKKDKGRDRNNDPRRKLRFHISSSGEYIYYVYPGDKKNRALANRDFLPLIYPGLNDLNKLLKISDIFEEFQKIAKHNPEIMPYIATMLCRIAYMKDHKSFRDELECGEFDVDALEFKELPPLDFTCYKLNLDSRIVTFFEKKHGNICNVSPESFFYYMDMLAQNEDMHYGKTIKTGEWSKGKNQFQGRTNFLLTCVRFIGFITGTTSCVKFFDGLLSSKVSPATPDEIRIITKGMFVVSP